MFDESVSNFNEKEATLYLKALLFLASADGDIQERERKFIESQVQILSKKTDVAVSPAEPDTGFLHQTTMSRAKRMALLRDCLMLASVDGFVDVFERRTLHEMARILDVSSMDMENLEQWVHSRRLI